MKTKGVLFDFGGTLLEYNREEIFRSLLSERKISVSREAVARAYAAADPQWYEQYPELRTQPLTEESLVRWDLTILKKLGVRADKDEMARYITKTWLRMENQLPRSLVRKAYSDARPCLEKVHGLGLRMGIVSNIESEDRLREELNMIDLTSYFPVLVASGSVGYAKPARQIFDTASVRMQLDPAEILFVGDDYDRDCVGALNAGMKPVLIDREARHGDRANIRRVTTLEHVPKLI